jgi:hypothetical protein
MKLSEFFSADRLSDAGPDPMVAELLSFSSSLSRLNIARGDLVFEPLWSHCKN